MGDTRIDQLQAGGVDAANCPVDRVYARHAPFYAVYRTTRRVMVHFADDVAQASRQRALLAPMGGLRSEVVALVDSWHDSDRPREQACAARYDSRVADALIEALEGDAEGGMLTLREVRSAILTERRSWARFEYLLVASATALAAFLLLVGLSTPWAMDRLGQFAGIDQIWLGGAGGTIGAFFSIATGLRGRTILTDLQLRDNACDAMLRVVVGVIGAGIVIALLQSGTIQSVRLGDTPVGAAPGAPWMRIFIIGFVAGFSERLLPDMLARSSLMPGTGELVPVAKPPAMRAPAAVPVPLALPAPIGGAPVQPVAAANDAAHAAGADADDGCICDVTLGAHEATDDTALPAASGGVASAAA